MLVASRVSFGEVGNHRRAARARDAAVEAWKNHAESGRLAALRLCLQEDADNPMGWYLLGCHFLGAGRIKDAARVFGMAYHRDVRIESAALLTFACLKAQETDWADILDQMAVTWVEMGRPTLLESTIERAALDVINGVPAGLSQLGQLAWITLSDRHRHALQERPADKADDWRHFFR